MGEYDDEIREAQRRAEEARDAWRRARDEMREAIRRAREARRRDIGETAREDVDETGKPRMSGASFQASREEIDETLQEIIGTAREFAREIGNETRRLADDVVQSAGRDWQGRWREKWEKQFGKDWRGHWVFGGRRFRQWTTGDEGANPFVSAILSRGGGLLALYVLNLLAEGPRHGNDIMRQIEQRTMGSWSSNPGAIYPLLSSMEENALVQSRWEDPDKRTRRAYHITDAGRRELERLRGVLRPKLMEAIEVLHILYDDLYESKGPASPSEEGGVSAPPAEPTRGDSEPRAGEEEPPSMELRAERHHLPGILRRLLGRGSEPSFGFHA